MDSLNFSNFFAGAFLCNCVPHLAAGLQGMSFPTPFAKPRGVGHSPALVNFLWGLLNVLLGGCMLWRHPVAMEPGVSLLTLVVGVLVMGVYLSVHFAKVRGAAPR